jgi:putative membrane protein
MGTDMGMGMGMGWAMALWGLVGLVVLVLAVLAAVWLVRSLINGSQAGGHGDRAEGELRALFAGGQIEEDEYRRRLETLRKR